MRYLLVSTTGQSLGLAMRIEREGHSCPMYVVNNRHPQKGFGIVSKLLAPRMLYDSDGVVNISVLDYLIAQATPDIVIFDEPAPKTVTDHLHKLHIKVIGSDPALLSQGPLPHVQDRLIAVDGWFNGQNIVGPFGYHVLYTRLLPGGKGVGPIVKTPASLSYYTFGLGAFRDAVLHAEMVLRTTAYRGPITGYAELGAKTISHFRGGLTECNASLFETMLTPASKFLVNIVNTAAEKVTLSDHHAASIRLTAQLWPSTAPMHNIALPGIIDKNLKHLWMNDVMLQQGIYRTTASGDGDIALLTARGQNLREATRRLQRTVTNVAAPETQYRFDVVQDTQPTREANIIFGSLLTASETSSKLRLAVQEEVPS